MALILLSFAINQLAAVLDLSYGLLAAILGFDGSLLSATPPGIGSFNEPMLAEPPLGKLAPLIGSGAVQDPPTPIVAIAVRVQGAKSDELCTLAVDSH